jgi:hypothetical protein
MTPPNAYDFAALLNEYCQCLIEVTNDGSVGGEFELGCSANDAHHLGIYSASTDALENANVELELVYDGIFPKFRVTDAYGPKGGLWDFNVEPPPSPEELYTIGQIVDRLVNHLAIWVDEVNKRPAIENNPDHIM